jgi:hypothetical protein
MLKPSELGLDGKELTISSYISKLENAIDSLSNKKMKRVLHQILQVDPNEKIDIQDLSQQEINEIKNYFAECVGPYLLYKHKLTSKVKVDQSSKCYFPSSQTEGLYDFSIIKNKDVYLFSNKQLKGGTNTLKAGDVVKLVGESPVLLKKWKDQKVFKVFKILNENNVIAGPISAIAELYPSASPVSVTDMRKIISQMVKNDVVIANPPATLLKMIKQDKAAYDRYNETKGVVSGTMVNYLYEKLLIQQSKEDPKFNELFLDVTTGNVYFLKFDLSKTGVVAFEVSDSSKAKKLATLRSKQGVERRSSSGSLKLDKLGFQP